MVKRKLKIGRLITALTLLVLIVGCIGLGIFYYELSPVDKNGSEINYEVKSGMTVNEIFEDLENKKIIRSALFIKIYSKIKGGIDIDAGEYKLSPSMNTKKIFEKLSGEASSSRETVTLVYKEGKNIRDLSGILEDITNIKKEEFINKLKDTEYLDSLISKYWFLNDDIKNKDIYYSLEGYLFPNTYTIYKDSSVEDVITKMLNETDTNK